MKNVSTKIAYMVIGSLLTIIGYHFGNIDNNTADAQEKADTPIVDEIRCRRLVVVNEDGETVVDMFSTSDRNDGAIRINNKDGQQLVGITSQAVTGDGFMAIHNRDGILVTKIVPTLDGDGTIAINNKDGEVLVNIAPTVETSDGAIQTYNKDGEVLVNIGTTETSDGSIRTYNKDGELVTQIGSDEYGGHMVIWNNKGFENSPKPIVRIGTTDEGNGVIATKDADGNDTDVLGEPNKILAYKDIRRLSRGPTTPRSGATIPRKWVRSRFSPEPEPVRLLLEKGDKLQPFNFNDIEKQSLGVETIYAAKGSRIRNKLFTHDARIIWFTNKYAWIELTDGTRYTSNTENCIIDMETHTISEGELLKSMSKDNQ